MSVIDEIKNKAKANKKTVVLPETTDMRTLTAAAEVISEEIADIILVGKDGNEEITVEEISALAGTFNYEFVCGLNKRIPRNYYYNGRYIGSHDYFHEKWNLEI